MNINFGEFFEDDSWNPSFEEHETFDYEPTMHNEHKRKQPNATQSYPLKKFKYSQMGDRSTQHTFDDEVLEGGNSSQGSYYDQVANVMSTQSRSVGEVDRRYSSVFSFKYFNQMQTEAFDTIYNSSMNAVVSSPTGSGKTVLFELAIIRLLRTHTGGTRPKVVYMAPIKALCQEKTQDWTQKFSTIGLVCKEVTGDSEIVNVEFNFRNVDVILTTPEKWDSMSRKWKDYGMMRLMSQVALMLIDEVHLLNEGRGAVLEAVVSRMKLMRASAEMADRPSAKLRFIALSATIPNIEDIAEWLEAPEEATLNFGEEYRPIKLDVKVVGVNNTSKSQFLFEKNLNFKLLPIIQEYSGGKSTIVFCSTRKSASEAAVFLAKEGGTRNGFIQNESHRDRLSRASKGAADKQLADCISKGVAFHSAGMSLEDRRLVERLFVASDLRVVCTTSTLAQGVNLPARLCIIKGTQKYTTGVGYEEYNELAIMQMIGRAGRPQFDDKGVADQNCTDQYENIVARKNPVESHMHRRMIEHLNAEIVLETIQDVAVAIQWVKSSFFYVRIRKNPTHYELPANISREKLDSIIKEMCVGSLQQLAMNEVIDMTEDCSLRPRDLGRSMARYYVKFETVKRFQNVTEQSSFSDVIRTLCSAKEFEEYNFRLGEKKILNAINATKDKIRFQVKGRVKDLEDKIFVLLQAAMTDIKIDEWTLKHQANTIMDVAPRISKCLTEYTKEKKLFSQHHYAHTLTKCIDKRMWETSDCLTKQLEGIGPVFSQSLAKAGIDSFEKILTADARRIESIVGRNPPFGHNLKETVNKIPRFDISKIKSSPAHKPKHVHVQVEVKRVNTAPNYNRIFYTLTIGNKDNEILDGKSKDQATFSILVDASNKANQTLCVRLDGEQFRNLFNNTNTVVGIDRVQEYKVKLLNKKKTIDEEIDEILEEEHPEPAKKKAVVPKKVEVNTPNTSLELMRSKSEPVAVKLPPRVTPAKPTQPKSVPKPPTPTPVLSAKQSQQTAKRDFSSHPATRTNLEEMVLQYERETGDYQRFRHGLMKSSPVKVEAAYDTPKLQPEKDLEISSQGIDSANYDEIDYDAILDDIWT